MTFPESKDPLTGNRKLHIKNKHKSIQKTSKISIVPNNNECIVSYEELQRISKNKLKIPLHNKEKYSIIYSKLGTLTLGGRLDTLDLIDAINFYFTKKHYHEDYKEYRASEQFTKLISEFIIDEQKTLNKPESLKLYRAVGEDSYKSNITSWTDSIDWVKGYAKHHNKIIITNDIPIENVITTANTMENISCQPEEREYLIWTPSIARILVDFSSLTEVINHYTKDIPSIPAKSRPSVTSSDLEGMSDGYKHFKTIGKIKFYKDSSGIVAKINNKEVGYVTKLPNSDTDLTVATDFQQQGIGTHLYTQFLILFPDMISKTGGLTPNGLLTFKSTLKQLWKIQHKS